MKKASVREFRMNLAELIEQSDPVIVTRHGSPHAVMYPLTDLRKVPAEVRRAVAESAARDVGVHETDDVIEDYKRAVDRTLIRENLRKTPTERMHALVEMQRLHAEVKRR